MLELPKPWERLSNCTMSFNLLLLTMYLYEIVPKRKKETRKEKREKDRRKVTEQAIFSNVLFDFTYERQSILKLN